MNKLTKILVVLPLITGLIATTLFFVQGGFGAGHGKFDQVIFFCGSPSIFLLEWLDQTPLAFPYLPDIVLIILLPTVVNIILFFLLGMALSYLWRKTKGKA